MCDEERLSDEILALENIYTAEELNILKENDQLGGHFLAFIVLETELKVVFKDLREPESCFQELLLDHLPPLSLLFSFPKEYPSSCPPDFTLSCQWLRRKDITNLCRKLDELWNENKGMEIMYIWTQFLKEESLKFLQMDKELDISKMYTYYLKYMECLAKRSKGLLTRRARSSGSRTCVRAPVEQSSMKEGANESALVKGNEECSEQARVLTDGEHHDGADENYIELEEPKPSDVNPIEDGKLIEGSIQNSSHDTKQSEAITVNNTRIRFSEENLVYRNERSYNRRRRRSTDLKRGKNVQNKNIQTKVDIGKDNMKRLGEVACGLSGTELKDNVNELKRNCDASPKIGQRQSGNHKKEAKLNNHNGLDAEHSTVNELEKGDVASTEVSVNVTNISVQGKGAARHQRYVRRPRSCPAEKENEFRRPQVKNGHKSGLDCRAVVDLSPDTSIIQHLMDYSIRRREIEFERSIHTCKICFEDKVGINCMNFEPCRHVFCCECITYYFEVRITEGTVISIPCPEDKCTSEAQPSQVRALVSHEMFSKYDSILLSAALEKHGDIMYCPRRQCQYPVLREDRDDTDRLATCPECNYSFCVLCKKVYHGVAPCAIASGEQLKLMQEYLNANYAHKKEMEVKYSRQQLKNIVDTYHLKWCELWIKKKTKKCPQCNSSIEKITGCNKMHCLKCDTMFCWTCKTKLDKDDPYKHFDDPRAPCLNNLHGEFRGVDIDFDPNFDEDF